MKNTIVIGVGPHGKRVISAVNASNNLNLFGVVDLSKDVLNALDLDQNVIKTDKLIGLLSGGMVEVACIVTNGPSHRNLAIQCIEAGVKHIMIEKPLACSLEECYDIKTIADKHNAKVIVDHPRRVSKNYGYIKSRLDNNEFGDFRTIYIQRPGIGLGCLATHSFDLACYYVGETPKTVTAWIDEPVGRNPRGDQFIDPGGTVILDFGNGKKGIISQIEDGAGPIFVELNTTKARIHVDEKTDRLEIITRDTTIKKGPNQKAGYHHEVNPDGVGGKRVLVDEVQWLLEDLVENESPQAKIQFGIDSIEILIAAYISHEKGNTPISLPLDASDLSKYLSVT